MGIIIIGMAIIGYFSYNLYDDYTEISEKRIMLEKEKSEFQKEQYKIKEELNNQKNKLLLLKRSIEDNENKFNISEKKLHDISLKYNNCMSEYKEYKTMMKNKEFSNSIENKIIKLMDKFSDLGVDLNKPKWCDRAYTKRYDIASSILKQISALIGSDDYLYKYNTFIQNNKSFAFSSNRECKQPIIKNR